MLYLVWRLGYFVCSPVFCSDHSVPLIILQLCLPFHHVSSCTVRLYVWHIPPQMWKKVSSDRHFACLYRAVLIFPDTMVIWPSPMIPNLGVCVYNIIILGMVIIPNHGPIIYIYIYIYIYVIHNNTTFDHGIMAHAFLSLTSLTSQQLSSWPVHLCWLWAVNLLGHGFSIPDFAMMGIQFSTNNCCFFDNFWTL